MRMIVAKVVLTGKSLSSAHRVQLGCVSSTLFQFLHHQVQMVAEARALELDFVGFVGRAIGLNFTLSFAASFT